MRLDMEFDNNFDFVDLFERRICEYTKFKYAVCVDCCTNGILIALEMKRRMRSITKSKKLEITKYTYLSVPMTLKLNGWKIKFVDDKWYKFYEIGDTKIFDAATDFHENMVEDYDDKNAIVCVSFQQKKRLNLGRGGVILTNNSKYYKMLKRMVHDGRNSHLNNIEEIENNPKNIILGYHCYLEPEKAVLGITKLNQPLPLYSIHSYVEYTDISKLNIW